MKKKLWLSIAAAALGAGLIIAASATASSKVAAHPAKASVARAGGTIVSELTTDIDYTDPQLSYYAPSWELEYATACKLFNYPDAEAPKGGTVVPEVAAGLPVVSKSGKKYTFTIRPGFKFSNGQVVTAESFKRAIERLADPKLQSTGSPFIGDVIVGAQAAIDGKASSVSGVTAAGNKLTINVLHPAPDLLARLAMPFFQAIDTTLAANRDPAGVNAYPSCGPYYFSARTPNRSITMKRNPFYKGTRPHNADTIQVNVGNTPDVIYQDTVNGTTDYAADGVPPAQWAGIAQKYGINKKQFFIRPELEVDYVAMNRDRPLFKNNPQLAQAVNVAVDRHAYTAQRGFLAGSRTNRILPPGMGGVTKKTEVLPFYPINVSSATIAKAQKLAAGHTRDGSAILWASNRGAAPLQAQIVQFNLKQIGINATIKLLPRAQQFGDAQVRGAAYDLTDDAWGADYNDPYDFINILLDGSTLGAQGSAGNNNFAYYNNAKFNTAMHKASLLFGAARTTAYDTLDKQMMAQDPPWAPVINRNNRLFVSSHLGCFLANPVFGVDYAAVCKK
jgi:ABC-type oligopeptide transport system substrate-binding subunit